MEPEKYPDLKVKLTPGSFLVGANRLYHILDVNRDSEIVKATLLGYDSNKCMYSFTLGNTHEFRFEEFTSEFWINYYKWRTAHHEDFIQYSNPYNFIQCINCFRILKIPREEILPIKTKQQFLKLMIKYRVEEYKHEYEYYDDGD
jgi:hypothetical protein